MNYPDLSIRTTRGSYVLLIYLEYLFEYLVFLYFLRLFYQDFWILETKTKGTDVPAASNVPLLLSSQWEQLNKFMHVSICKSGMCLLYHQDFIINRWLYFLTSFERFVYLYVYGPTYAIVFTWKSG